MGIIQDRNSQAATILEEAWRQLRKLDRRVPAAVILVLSAGDRPGKLGHFSGSSWQYSRQRHAHEVAVNPALFGSAEDLLATLLHEAAHAILYNDAGGVTGRYYHRVAFRDTSRELGLACGFRNSRYGWTNTHWPASGVPRRYRPVLKILRRLPRGTVQWQLPPPPKGRPLPKIGWVRLICSCEPSRTIYAARSVASDGEIECGRCGEPFSPPR